LKSIANSGNGIDGEFCNAVRMTSDTRGDRPARTICIRNEDVSCGLSLLNEVY
jgi:hypothetical protein